MTYSILVHKATRGPKLVEKEMSLPAAMARADTLYAEAKTLHGVGLAVSGISVMVVTDQAADELLAKGTVNIGDDITFQFGGF